MSGRDSIMTCKLGPYRCLPVLDSTDTRRFDPLFTRKAQWHSAISIALSKSFYLYYNACASRSFLKLPQRLVCGKEEGRSHPPRGYGNAGEAGCECSKYGRLTAWFKLVFFLYLLWTGRLEFSRCAAVPEVQCRVRHESLAGHILCSRRASTSRWESLVAWNYSILRTNSHVAPKETKVQKVLANVSSAQSHRPRASSSTNPYPKPTSPNCVPPPTS